MKDNFEIFSDNLKRLREFYNMKQIDLEKKSMIPRSTLSYYESKKSEPTLTSLIGIANSFNITIDDLVKVELNDQILIEKEEKNKKYNLTRKISNSMIFSKKLKKLRLEKGLTQVEVSERSGVFNISSFEANKTEPRLSAMIKIGEFFNVKLDDLVTEEIDIYKFTKDEIEFFKKIDFDFESVDDDKDFLNLLNKLKRYYLRRAEKLTELVNIQIPSKIREIESIIELIELHKNDNDNNL